MALGFYQRRNELVDMILESRHLKPATKCIGIKLLVGYMNNEHETAWMSAGTLAKKCNVRTETVRRALSRLVKYGFLDRQRRTGRTTIYWMGGAWRAASDPGPGDQGPRRYRDRHPGLQDHPNLNKNLNNNLGAEKRRDARTGRWRKLTGEDQIRRKAASRDDDEVE